MKRERRAALMGKTVGLSAVAEDASNDEGATAPKSLNDHMLATSTDLVPTAKAYFVGESGANESRALVEQDKATKLLLSKGALEPAYPPNMLALVYENSSSLRQNVDAYVTNIDSFGHSYVPVIDVDDVSADERIRDAIRAERQAGIMSGATLKKSDDEIIKASKEPTDGDVKTRKDQLRIDIRAEREALDAFFDNCTPTMPFAGPEGLRGLTRQDIEVFGNGYWEILRNKLGQISQFNRIDGRSVRLMPEDDKPTEVEIDRKISLLATEKINVKKRFRRYVQTYEPGTQLVYFKEFGDPRCVDAKTGLYYKDLKEMTKQLQKDDPKAVIREATEIYPFKITSVRGPYGVPRWMGTLLCVLGTRQAEEVNFLYFENKSVPPMAILVSGGHLNADTVKRLEDYITNEIRGKRNFHKIMILEAEAGAGADPNVSGKMKITLQPLTDAQQKDALFQGYDERNSDKVGQAFRLPRILRGDIRDFNRSTAEAALDFAELQVFGPLRQDFDWRMNKLILPSLGIKYHTFRSNAPTIRDPQALSDILVKMTVANILTPGEARELAELVFNRSLTKIKAPWTDQPIGLSLIAQQIQDNIDTPIDETTEYGKPAGGVGAGIMSTPGAGGPAQRATGAGASKPAGTSKPTGMKKSAMSQVASGLQKIHASLLDAEREEWDENRAAAEVIKVPYDLMRSWIRPDPKPADAKV